MNGCLLIQFIFLPISFGDKIKSTTPAAIADFGILLYFAESSCAKVIPPAVLISFNPCVPSFALPESTMPITFSLCVSAKEENKISIERM